MALKSWFQNTRRIEKGTPTHPELLQWLGRELVQNGYQVKALVRTIMNSAAYQRAVDPALKLPDPLYSACEPRRLSAEQIVDSLFAVTGKPFVTEPISIPRSVVLLLMNEAQSILLSLLTC